MLVQALHTNMLRDLDQPALDTGPDYKLAIRGAIAMSC